MLDQTTIDLTLSACSTTYEEDGSGGGGGGGSAAAYDAHNDGEDVELGGAATEYGPF